MDEKLLKKYLEYAATEEALTVLFVKKHLINAKKHWVDIVDYDRYEMSDLSDLHFRFVEGGLYKRKINLAIHRNLHTPLMANLMNASIT